MKKVYFLTNKAGDSVFEAHAERHGQLPAFFSNQAVASKFFGTMVEEQDQDQHTFGETDDADSIRRFLNFNEKSYVLLDLLPMTGVEMFEALKD